jgi:dihydrofolate reductase
MPQALGLAPVVARDYDEAPGSSTAPMPEQDERRALVRPEPEWSEELASTAMKTQYYTASSLDGFIADRDNSLDWLMQFGSVDVSSYPDFIRDVGAIAMGSTTYEWLLRHEIRPDSDEPKPWPYEQPTWVFTSRSLPTIRGADIRFARGDVRPVHREMVAAAGGKNVWVVGGGELVGQFHDHGLLDELIIQVAPVTLGGGAPLLPRAIATPPLRLVSVTPFGEGFAELRYEVPRPRGEGGRPEG